MARQEIKHQQPNWDGPVNQMFKELYEVTTALSGETTVDQPNTNYLLTNGVTNPGNSALRVWQVKHQEYSDIYGSGYLHVPANTDRFKIKFPYYCVVGDYRSGQWYNWGDISFQIEENNSITVIFNGNVTKDLDIWINFHVQHNNKW